MKKIVAMLLIGVMCLGVLAGCGKSGTGKDAGNSGNAIGTKDNPVKVSIMIKDLNPTDENIPEMTEAIEKGLEAQGKYIDIEFLEAPTGTYKEAVPLAFRTGQISPDIIYLQGGDEALANDGMLEDLTPYIEKSTYIKSLMEDYNVERMKNYPYLLWLAPARVSTPVVRKDITEKTESYTALMEDPTIDNYYKFFKEIVDKNLAKYATTSDGDLTRLDSVFNHAFGVTSTVMKVDGKWVFSKATEYEKNKLEFYAKLYKEGLIDPAYITNAWDTMEKSFYEGESAVIAGTAGSVIEVYNNKMVQTQGENAELVVLPPAKGISQAYTSIDVTKETRGFAINAQSKVKDAAFAVLEFMASPEGRMIDKLGIEGVHYNVEGDKIVYTDKFPEWYSKFWETTKDFEPTPALAEPLMGEAATDSLKKAEEYYYEDINVLIPSELSPQWDAMKALYNEYSSDIIRGVKPISAFDEFVQKWNEAGGNDFSQYLSEQLD